MYDKNENYGIKIFQARWVLPVSKPPIENGVVVTQGNKILQVDAANQIDPNLMKNVQDLGDSIIFPGFVNIHTHLEQGAQTHPLNSYDEYLRLIYRTRNSQDAEQKIANITKNIMESVRFGTVAVADFSQQGHSYLPLTESSLYARVFQEIRGFQKSKVSQIIRQHTADIDQTYQQKDVTMHLAPSSVWENSPELMQEIAVRERHTAIHLSVTMHEKEFTYKGSGFLKQLLLSDDNFDYSWKTPGISPVQYFVESHFYTRHNILVHMNEVDNEDIQLIKNFPAKANICLCPRSEERLNLKKAPVQMFMDNGINICLGTESRTVVQDMDLRKEIVKCVEIHGVSPEAALKFATLNGAYSIGFHKEVGSLEPGKTSRCLVLNCRCDELKDPYDALVSSGSTVKWLTEGD